MSDESKPDLNAIYRELLAGDATARERLILAAMPIADLAARHVKSRNSDARPISLDDLQSEATVAIIEFIDKRSAPQIFLCAAIFQAAKRALLDHCINNMIVGPSARTVQIRRGALSDDGLVSCKSLFTADSPTSCVRNCGSELLEELLSLCVTEREREIVLLSSADADNPPTDDTIAESIGCARETVVRTRAKLRERFEPWHQFLGA